MKLDIRELFLRNAVLTPYNRLDTIVRYITIEAYYQGDPKAFDMYHKMQRERIGSEEEASEWMSRFKKLIKSFETDGYKNNYSYLTVGKDLEVHDGSHRTALCLYHNIFEADCNIIDYSRKVEYGLDWFLDHGFDNDEIRTIIQKYNCLVEEYTMPYLIVVECDDIHLTELRKILQLAEITIESRKEKNGKKLLGLGNITANYKLLDGKLINVDCVRLKKLIEKKMGNGIVCCFARNYSENILISKAW
jgi:hypothetical protein